MKILSRAAMSAILLAAAIVSVSCGVQRAAGKAPSGAAESTLRTAVYPAPLSYLGEQKWGYIDKTGRFAIKPDFSQAERFQPNGLAVAGKGGKVGLIDAAGKFVVAPAYNTIAGFSEGLAIAQDDGGFKVIDSKGEVISRTYPYIGDYSSGRAPYYVMNGDGGGLRYGYLDESGNTVISPAFEYAGSFDGDRAVVKLPGKGYAIIDRDGNILKNLKYSYVMDLSDGMAAFVPEQGGRYGYLDKNGDIAVAPAFLTAMNFENGAAVVNPSADYTVNKYGLIDKRGKYLIEPQYNDILQLGENRTAVGIAADVNNIFAGSRYALSEREGKILTDFVFYGIGPFRDGTASAYNNTETFFIDKTGEKVESLPTAEGIGTLELLDGIIYADIDKRPYYMNSRGEVIYRPSDSVILKSGIKVSEKKFRPNRNYLVYYPVLSNMENLGIEQSVNARLRDMWIDASVEPGDNLDYSYEGGFEIVFDRKNLLVLRENGYDYPFGAAHGMPVMQHVHVDTASGAFYSLEELFKEGGDYVGVLSGIVEEQIKLHGEEMGVWPDSYKGIEPDQPFYVTADALMLYFRPYEIAPYAAGFPTFRVPYDEISGIINKKGSFWRSFN